jgi:hypothetical protein
MATRREVTCINKSDRQNPHERITHIGGVHNGVRWKLRQEDAIAGIENKTMEFFVRKGGHIVEVIVGIRLGRKYLKTQNDGDSPDNLLSLPECP